MQAAAASFLRARQPQTPNASLSVGSSLSWRAGAPRCAAGATRQTCRRCKREYVTSANDTHACTYHPALFTGGEQGKYTGFVPDSPAPEHRMKARGTA